MRHQARKAQEMAQNYAPIDENADARIKQEALDERTSIKKTSEKMGLAIHEVLVFHRNVDDTERNHLR